LDAADTGLCISAEITLDAADDDLWISAPTMLEAPEGSGVVTGNTFAANDGCFWGSKGTLAAPEGAFCSKWATGGIFVGADGGFSGSGDFCCDALPLMCPLTENMSPLARETGRANSSAWFWCSMLWILFLMKFSTLCLCSGSSPFCSLLLMVPCCSLDDSPPMPPPTGVTTPSLEGGWVRYGLGGGLIPGGSCRRPGSVPLRGGPLNGGLMRGALIGRTCWKGRGGREVLLSTLLSSGRTTFSVPRESLLRSGGGEVGCADVTDFTCSEIQWLVTNKEGTDRCMRLGWGGRVS
jgi:hypothetical protein